MHLPRFSIGVGDRFAHQGLAQLDAVLLARREGVEVTPVWNKSHREHSIVGSRPADVRAEADAAVALRRYDGPYFVDADHIRLETVDPFVEPSDFFTLDVADSIGRPADPASVGAFARRHRDLIGPLALPGLDPPIAVRPEDLEPVAGKFLAAVREAGELYRRLAAVKGAEAFVTEVSMDETDSPQTPVELLLILAAVADEGIPAATIAPRYRGRFNKGVDYVGDVEQFAAEFEADLAVVAFAAERFGLPEGLKLSVHSGSDKFSIYRPMARALRRFGAGIHLKTAGTTWLEEIIGLAAAGGDGLALAKDVYREAFGRFDELCGPYATVIDIDRAALPSPEQVDRWDAATMAGAVRHDPACEAYDANVRQLLHVGYKVAAEMGTRYTAALERHADVIAAGVTENLFERHIRPLLLDNTT